MMAELTPTPLAHSNDPASSHEAVERHTKSGRRWTHGETVYMLVRRCGKDTSRELAEHAAFYDIDLTELRRRLTDLKNKGRIERGEQRICRVAGTKACTWWAVELF